LDHGKIEPPDHAQGNPTLAAPCYYARLQFGQQGKTVASTMAQQVFLEIRNIARSDITLPEQRAEAAKRIEQFKADHDDYSEIMAKALADRLAEALAELLHERVRKEFWGYAKQEKLSMDEIIHEKYEGIRPAPGYPACPDHTEKKTIFELLDADKAGIWLTESYAMYPGAAVSGYYFSHPESTYFGLGNIEKDQVTEYAQRKGMEIKEIERWLSPNLAY